MRLIPFALLLAACGGPSSDGGGARGGACLPIAPMQLLVVEHGTEWKPVAYLAPDGTVYQGVNKQPGPAFRIVGDAIYLPNGQFYAQCTQDRQLRVNVRGTAIALRFDNYDALVDPSRGNQRAIYVYDSGDVEVGVVGPARRMPWRVTGVTPATRRSAEILVLGAIASADWNFH